MIHFCSLLANTIIYLCITDTCIMTSLILGSEPNINHILSKFDLQGVSEHNHRSKFASNHVSFIKQVTKTFSKVSLYPHYPPLFLFSISKEFANVCLRFSHVLVQDFWPVDHFGLSGIQHLANLSRQESLTTTRGPIQQDAFNVLTA